MPYFIYKIKQTPILQLQKIEQHDAYRDASARAKVLRAELRDEQCTIKMIFAEHELGAEDLLSQVREPAPQPGDD
ncbi:MAG: hypothetical protein WA435_07010 [Gallionellaceae bacterium]